MHSSHLVWEIVKNHNAFIRKGLNGTVLSAEPGNLYNLHNYKHSGLANGKYVDIREHHGNIMFSKKSEKHAQQPNRAAGKKVLKRDARRVLKAVGAEVQGYRKDLKSHALARASAVIRSIKKTKATSRAK